MVTIDDNDEQENSAEQSDAEADAEPEEIEESGTPEKVADPAEAATETATASGGIGGVLVAVGVFLLLAMADAVVPDTDGSSSFPLLD